MARSLREKGGFCSSFVHLSFIFFIFYLSFSGLFFGIFFPTFCGLSSYSFIFCFLIFYLSFFGAGFVSFFNCLLSPSFLSILSFTFLSLTYVYACFWVPFFFAFCLLVHLSITFLSFTYLFVSFLTLFPSASWGLEF